MTRFDRFVTEKNTYQSYEDFAWAIWKERETLIEALEKALIEVVHPDDAPSGCVMLRHD